MTPEKDIEVHVGVVPVVLSWRLFRTCAGNLGGAIYMSACSILSCSSDRSGLWSSARSARSSRCRYQASVWGLSLWTLSGYSLWVIVDPFGLFIVGDCRPFRAIHCEWYGPSRAILVGVAR